MRELMVRRRNAAVGICAVVAVMVSVGAFAAGASGRPPAQSARTHTLNATEDASLHLVKKSGSVLNERGSVTGTLSGSVSARFVTSIVKVTGTVTIYPHGGGSLTITVLGYPRSAATIAQFSGSISVKSGTGRYAHARGSGTFTGTVNRRTWAATVHAKAKLIY